MGDCYNTAMTRTYDSLLCARRLLAACSGGSGARGGLYTLLVVLTIVMVGSGLPQRSGSARAGSVI